MILIEKNNWTKGCEILTKCIYGDLRRKTIDQNNQAWNRNLQRGSGCKEGINDRNKWHDKGEKSVRFEGWLCIWNVEENESKMKTQFWAWVMERFCLMT